MNDHAPLIPRQPTGDETGDGPSRQIAKVVAEIKDTSTAGVGNETLTPDYEEFQRKMARKLGRAADVLEQIADQMQRDMRSFEDVDNE